MTVANPGSPAERLASVRARLEAALKDPSSIISGALIGLETDVASVCATIPNLPPKEAHALAPEMKHVIGLLADLNGESEGRQGVFNVAELTQRKRTQR